MPDFAPSVRGPRIARGATAGLLGGLVFGLLMQQMGLLPMVAMLVGSTSLAVGWTIHLAISLALGAAFGFFVATDRLGSVLLYGLALGVVMWIAGAMIVMRIVLGIPVVLDEAALDSLLGHLVFGALLGGAYALLANVFPETTPERAALGP